MKSSVQLVVLVSSLLSLGANARVIYGEDNRTEVKEASEFHQKLARSTATMISSTKMLPDAFIKGVYHLDQTSLRSMIEQQLNESDKSLYNLLNKVEGEDAPKITFCEGERFVDQPTAGTCSGFLIAPDLLVTAGHCVALPTFCDEFKWVFDYQIDESGFAGYNLKPENIYSCKKVISNDLSVSLNVDYAVVQLDRRVENREPLEIRNDGRIENFTSLIVIGSPSGLPTKVATGAHVRNNSHPFFFNANLDSYQGNSGSAVFNDETGLVEGILVRGDQDYVGNQKLMCLESNRCTNEGCRGEDVSRLTSIPEVGVQVAFNQAAEEGDILTLQTILSMNLWVDFYTKDGETALMKAASVNQVEAMRLLLAKNADVMLTDAKGNTVAHHVVKNLSLETIESLDLLPKELLLVVNTAGETLLHAAAKANNIAAIEILLERGLDINAKDKAGETILFALARNENKEAIGRILDLGANGQIMNKEGKTFLDLDQIKNQIIVTR